MPTTTLTVLVVLRDSPHALGRLLARCHARGWVPISIHSVSDETLCEVSMRLRVQSDKRGTEAQVRNQLGRLVEVEHVALERSEGLPDHVAFHAVRRLAAFL